MTPASTSFALSCRTSEVPVASAAFAPSAPATEPASKAAVASISTPGSLIRVRRAANPPASRRAAPVARVAMATASDRPPPWPNRSTVFTRFTVPSLRWVWPGSLPTLTGIFTTSRVALVGWETCGEPGCCHISRPARRTSTPTISSTAAPMKVRTMTHLGVFLSVGTETFVLAMLATLSRRCALHSQLFLMSTSCGRFLLHQARYRDRAGDRFADVENEDRHLVCAAQLLPLGP